MICFVAPPEVIVATPFDISSPSLLNLVGDVERAPLLLDVPDRADDTDFPDRRLRDDERALFCSDDNVLIPLSSSDLLAMAGDVDGGATSKLAGVMSEFTDEAAVISLYR